jgi:GTPase
MEVLEELGAADKPVVTVFNKVDATDAHTLKLIRAQHPEALFISVHTGEGLDRLLARCEELAVDDSEAVELLIPHSRYDVVAKLHQGGQVRRQESRDEGVFIAGRFPAKQKALYDPFRHAAPAPKRKGATKRTTKT